MVEGRFRDGITAGEIPSDFPVAVRAIQVTDFARGLTMRAQMARRARRFSGMPRKRPTWCSCRDLKAIGKQKR